MNAADPKPFKVAIIGGGPGGLFTAWHLAAKAGLSCQITVFEASGRLGGNSRRASFRAWDPMRPGVAEIYDYSNLGPDPLHDLIVKELGLEIKHIQGGPCVLDGKIVLETDDLAKLLWRAGPRRSGVVSQALRGFAQSRSLLFLRWQKRTMLIRGPKFRAHDLLEREFADDVARRYIRAMAHSDVAAPRTRRTGSPSSKTS